MRSLKTRIRARRRRREIARAYGQREIRSREQYTSLAEILKKVPDLPEYDGERVKAGENSILRGKHVAAPHAVPRTPATTSRAGILSERMLELAEEIRTVAEDDRETAWCFDYAEELRAMSAEVEELEKLRTED